MEDPDLDSYFQTLSILASQVFIGFSSEAIISVIILVVLVVASGMVSGTETAFFSMTPNNLNDLRLAYSPKNQLILDLRSKPKTLLATVLISNNFINVAIVILSTYLTSITFDFSNSPVLGFIIQVFVITSVILIFGEIIPKIVANKDPIMIANFMAIPIKILITLFYPLSRPLVKSTMIIDKRISKKGHNISISDLSDAIDLTVDESAPDDEKMILKGIASFVEIEVSEIMQSRVNMTTIENKLSFKEMMEVVHKSGFSRIPVFEETIDKVIGILYIKDLLPYIDETEKPDWLSLIRPAFFVPENKKIKDLLQEFRERKIHLAIVVDEYGGTSGMITLEDIIEEIVGEISDEYDKEGQQFLYRKISSRSYLFEAKTPLNDLCKILGLSDDQFESIKGESDSLGGLILEIEGNIPEKGKKISIGALDLLIIDVDSRKINQVKVTVNSAINKS